MKIVISSIAFVAGVCLFAACGPAPCDTLKTQCDACKNTTAKSACEATVALGRALSQDTCKAVVDAKTYEASGSACSAAN